MQIPSNAKIEDRAIGALSNIIDDHPTMAHQFNSMDKEMSWDGYIWIFKDIHGSQDKNNYDDKISVQIKGHIDKEEKYINKKQITYSVELTDLQVYFQDRGVLYFEVFMSEDGKKREIFYSSLFPTKIKSYLEKANMKHNKKSINVVFTKLENNSVIFYAIVKQFSNESRKQGCGIEQMVQNAIKVSDMDKVKELTASVVGAGNEYEFLKRLGAGDVNFYGVLKGSPFMVPLEWHEKSVYVLCKEVNSCVCIAGKQYYDKYKLQTSSEDIDESVLQLSDNLKIKINKCEFNFKPLTGIKELRNDAEFLMAATEHTEAVIDNVIVPFGKVNMPKELKKELQFFIDLYDTFSMIEFEYDKKFREISKVTLQHFIEIVAMKKGLRNDRLTDKMYIYNLKVDDKYIPVVIIKNPSGGENILFSAIYTRKYQTYVSNSKGEHYIVPRFAYVSVHAFSNLYEYKYNYFYEQINKAEINKDTSGTINNSVLNLIHAYDSTKDENLLEIALYTLKRLKSVLGQNNIFLINEFQIEKRKGCLCAADISSLSIIESDDLQFLCAKSILMENRAEAVIYYNQMNEENRHFFEGLPIFTLYKDLFIK